jgi:hypothetical protein
MTPKTTKFALKIRKLQSKTNKILHFCNFYTISSCFHRTKNTPLDSPFCALSNHIQRPLYNFATNFFNSKNRCDSKSHTTTFCSYPLNCCPTQSTHSGIRTRKFRTQKRVVYLTLRCRCFSTQNLHN